MTRSACVSPGTNASSPSPEAIVCDDTAPASGHPEHPPVLCSSPGVAVTLTSDVHVTGSPAMAGVVGVTGVGSGAVVVGGAVVGGVVAGGVVVEGAAAVPGSFGTFTRK